jgi:hypothetical protein
MKNEAEGSNSRGLSKIGGNVDGFDDAETPHEAGSDRRKDMSKVM